MRSAVIALMLSLVGFDFAVSLGGQDQRPRPPITGIAHVRLWSADPSAAVDFYSKILGFTSRDAGCVGMMRPCYILSEHQQIALAKGASGSHANLLAEVAFVTSDAMGMHGYLQAHNIRVNPVTRDFNGAVHFSFQDPAGPVSYTHLTLPTILLV